MKEFLSVPELRENPLVQRVADVLDSNRSGEVDFKGKINTRIMVYNGHREIRLVLAGR